MALSDVAGWIAAMSGERRTWYIKRLAANDTLATGHERSWNALLRTGISGRSESASCKRSHNRIVVPPSWLWLGESQTGEGE